MTENTSKLDIDLGGTVLTEEQKEEIQNFLSKWTHILSKGPTDLGRTNLFEHELRLEDERSFKEPCWKRLPALVDEVRDHLKEMLEIRAIRESTGPFISNVVIVRKKDGTIRFCTDYRKLNQRTTNDAYPIPRIDDTLHALARSRFHSTLDLKSEYWQVELTECDKPKTAGKSPLLRSVALCDTACSGDTQEETSEEILPSTALSGVN